MAGFQGRRARWAGVYQCVSLPAYYVSFLGMWVVLVLCYSGRIGTGRSSPRSLQVLLSFIPVPTDATDVAQHLIWYQIETAMAEPESRTERMHIDNAETKLRSEGMAIARLKLDTERAELLADDR